MLDERPDGHAWRLVRGTDEQKRTHLPAIARTAWWVMTFLRARPFAVAAGRQEEHGYSGHPSEASLFAGIDARPVISTSAELLAVMDAADVGAAVVSIMEPGHAEWVANAPPGAPPQDPPGDDRGPNEGHGEVRRVVRYHDEFGVRCLRIPPFRYTLPPTDRVYWPFYVKAIELDIPVSMNAGMPGPRRPGWVQNPVHVDEVAFHFPELRVIMSHCGQPWADEAISVMTHWDNVFMLTTSVAPKYWPEPLVQFINTRGKEKMMYGTEYPTIPWDRSRADIDALPVRPEVGPAFFAENARRVFKWDADVS